MHTAKLFMNGRSQAVRLPAALRFDGVEVHIRRDPDSGDVILSPLNRSFAEWLKQRDQAPADFTEGERKALDAFMENLDQGEDIGRDW